jgi:hypothetical protein
MIRPLPPRVDLPSWLESRILAITEVSRAWLDQRSPWTGRLCRAERRTGGLSEPMIRECLKRLFRPYLNAEGLHHWVRRVGCGGSGIDDSPASKTTAVMAPSTVYAATWQAAVPIWLAGHKVLLRPSSRSTLFSKSLIQSVRFIAGSRLPIQVWQGTNVGWEKRIRDLPLIIYGTDETVEYFRRLKNLGKPLAKGRRGSVASKALIPFGSRISIAVIGGKERVPMPLIRKLALDAILYETQGCLSPSLVFVRGSPERARTLARQLGDCMKRLGRRLPPPPRSWEGYETESFWQQWRFRASQGRGEIFRDHVIYTPEYSAPSGLSRVLIVHPFETSQDLVELCGIWSSRLSTVAIHSSEAEGASWVRALSRCSPGLRICKLGEMHEPAADWENCGIDLLKTLRRI